MKLNDLVNMANAMKEHIDEVKRKTTKVSEDDFTMTVRIPEEMMHGIDRELHEMYSGEEPFIEGDEVKVEICGIRFLIEPR